MVSKGGRAFAYRRIGKAFARALADRATVVVMTIAPRHSEPTTSGAKGFLAEAARRDGASVPTGGGSDGSKGTFVGRFTAALGRVLDQVTAKP
jgi:hypothetical protein